MKEFKGNAWTEEIDRLRKMEATVKALVEKTDDEIKKDLPGAIGISTYLLCDLLSGLKIALAGGPVTKFNVCYRDGAKCLEEVQDGIVLD